MRKPLASCLFILLPVLWVAGCSSGPPVKSQAYARLKNTRTFEYELPAVWSAIQAVVKDYKVLSQEPEEATPQELRKLSEASLETDWIYSQSRDKYVEYRVNDLPKKRYLQTRIQYAILARKGMGGTDVAVETTEELELLNEDGTPAGYESSDQPDPSRANEIIDKINLRLLSSKP